MFTAAYGQYKYLQEGGVSNAMVARGGTGTYIGDASPVISVARCGGSTPVVILGNMLK